MTIKLEEITRSREEEIENLWSEHRRILNEYVMYMDSFYAEYSDLREKDEANTVRIRNYYYEVTKLTNQLTELKLEADNTIEEGESQTSYLESHRDSVNKKYLKSKKNLEITLKTDEANFRFLGVCGHEALTDLQKYHKNGTQLLQLAAVCRRLESEREKIISFNFMKDMAFEKSTDEMRQPPDDFKQYALENWYRMELFWERVNRVKLDNACLREEKNDLEIENSMLKAQLKDYLTSVTIANGPNGNIHDRMFSRPSSMKVEKVVRINLAIMKKPGSSPAGGGHPPSKKMNVKIKRRPYTCIEANLSNAVRSQQLIARKLTTAKLDAIVW